MRFEINHNNINVADLNKSLDFYKKALNMVELRRKDSQSYTIVFLKDQLSSHHALELTYLKDRKDPYNLGDNEIHLAFKVDEFDLAKKMHENMNVICYDNKEMGIYFISDPDGYWIEILPVNRK